MHSDQITYFVEANPYMKLIIKRSKELLRESCLPINMVLKNMSIQQVQILFYGWSKSFYTIIMIDAIHLVWYIE